MTFTQDCVKTTKLIVDALRAQELPLEDQPSRPPVLSVVTSDSFKLQLVEVRADECYGLIFWTNSESQPRLAWVMETRAGSHRQSCLAHDPVEHHPASHCRKGRWLTIFRLQILDERGMRDAIAALKVAHR